MGERSRFTSVWVNLSPRRRWEISKLAWLGRRAPDPESAWLTVGIIRSTPWGRLPVWGQLVSVGAVAAFGVNAWRAVTPGAGIVILAFAAWFLSWTLAFRRALRLNEPIARPPEGVEEA